MSGNVQEGFTPSQADRPPFVDAHVHFWDRGRLRYPWLDDPAMAAISATFLPASYREEVRDWNLAAAVHVEAGAAPEDALAETRWLQECAAETGLPSVIVAHVMLDDPDIDRTLDLHAACSRVRGVRHLVNWHPTEAALRVQPHDPVMDPGWAAGYARLASRDLSFDFHGFPQQLPGLVAIARRYPDVPLILNHLALPKITDGLEAWRDALTALAELPLTSIKLSGAGFVHEPFDPIAFREVVLPVIDTFGTSRVMVATNLPTDRLFASVDRTLEAYERILSSFSTEERRDLWGRNADRIYRLGLAL
jgi:predicted TIM-barrel fold metal-dependent hydrolase